MVQVIDDAYNGNIFGRLGKGIGKGLSEQVPKEIERYRLSSGLEQLGQDAKGGKLTPLEIYTKAAGIPGMTPQHLYTIAPIIQEQMKRQNFLNRGEGGGIPDKRPGGKPISDITKVQSEQPDLAARDSGFASPIEIAQYKQDIAQEPDFLEVNDLAKQYINEGITQDPQEASNLAKNQLLQDRAAQQQKIQAFKEDFGGEKGRFALELQKGGLGNKSFNAVAGKIQQALLDQGEYLMATQGLTPEAAALEMTNIATELGKTANETLNTGSMANMFKSKRAKTTDLRAQKQDFERYGFGEIFDDMATAALGITPLEAAHVLSPLKNKEVEGLIKGTKKTSQKSTANNIPEEKLEKIIRSMTQEDNLYAIEYLLRDKHLDIQQFKDKVLEMSNAKEIKLSPQQRRQLKRSVSESFLGDLLFEML
jgi:hypothetical protein